jgi:hypothetical protein
MHNHEKEFIICINGGNGYLGTYKSLYLSLRAKRSGNLCAIGIELAGLPKPGD